MKTENLERAEELAQKLRQVDDKIKAVENAEFVQLLNGGYPKDAIKTNDLQENRQLILDSVKPQFLNVLRKEREAIVQEIEELE